MARLFNHIGAGQAPTFAIYNFARQIAEISAGKRQPVLKVCHIDITRDLAATASSTTSVRAFSGRCGRWLNDSLNLPVSRQILKTTRLFLGP